MTTDNRKSTTVCAPVKDLQIMAHSPCTGPGQGLGLGPGMMGFCITLYILYTLHKDRDNHRFLLCPSRSRYRIVCVSHNTV